MKSVKDTMGIVEWYEGRTILITGGTGFMGKVLVEKIVRVLPVKNVYVIIREKRGIAPQERLQNMFKLPIFDKIRNTQPELLNKIIALDGDITMKDFGLADDIIKTLQHEVSVVFHNAASLKLEADLKHAITFNTRGTKYAMEFCLKLPKVEAVIHLSTAFCHVDIEILEEKYYPASNNPDDIIRLVDMIDEDALNLIQSKLLGPHPNCYTYSKRLAETIVDGYKDRLPLVIIRPSIVIPAIYEPVPGWVDSLNGPIGILVGAGKGVIRNMMVDDHNHAEVIPVDIAINAMIVAAWDRSKKKNIVTLQVCNVSSSNNTVNITWKEVLDRGRRMFYKYPFNWPVIWYPDGSTTTNKYLHYFITFVLHTIPAYFIDFLMFIFLQPRFMIRIHNRIATGLELLQYFTMRKWTFCNDYVLRLTNRLSEKELEIFYLANVSNYDIDEYLKNAILGARQYCLKDDLSTLPRARRILKFLRVLDLVTKFFLFYWLCYFILHLFGVDYVFSINYWFKSTEKSSIREVSLS